MPAMRMCGGSTVTRPADGRMGSASSWACSMQHSQLEYRIVLATWQKKVRQSALFQACGPLLIYLAVPRPETKVPQGIMLQMLTAFLGAFIYLIALFYSINDLGAVFSSTITYFPTAEIYLQATGSTAGAVGLIAVLFIATFPTLIGTFVTGGRMWWSLARDNATPFSGFFAKVSPGLNSPARATIAMSAMVTCIGCIYVGSTTAFQALISSYVVLSTLSYAGAILPHVLTGRKNIVPGPFYMGRALGFFVNITSLIYIFVTIVFFCFPFVLPVTTQTMNYTSVITVGLMTLSLSMAVSFPIGLFCAACLHESTVDVP